MQNQGQQHGNVSSGRGNYNRNSGSGSNTNAPSGSYQGNRGNYNRGGFNQSQGQGQSGGFNQNQNNDNQFCVFVGNLDERTTKEEIIGYFETYGTVLNAKLMIDHETSMYSVVALFVRCLFVCLDDHSHFLYYFLFFRFKVLRSISKYLLVMG